MGSVVAALETREMARRAVDELIAACFGPERVSVVARAERPADGRAEDLKTVGPLAGAFVGAGLAQVFPALLDVVGVAVPGLDSIVALGPLAAAAGGLVVGLVGFLVARGLSQQDAQRYAEHLRAGGYLVAAECDEADAPRGRSPGPRRRQRAELPGSRAVSAWQLPRPAEPITRLVGRNGPRAASAVASLPRAAIGGGPG